MSRCWNGFLPGQSSKNSANKIQVYSKDNHYELVLARLQLIRSHMNQSNSDDIEKRKHSNCRQNLNRTRHAGLAVKIKRTLTFSPLCRFVSKYLQFEIRQPRSRIRRMDGCMPWHSLINSNARPRDDYLPKNEKRVEPSESGGWGGVSISRFWQ